MVFGQEIMPIVFSHEISVMLMEAEALIKHKLSMSDEIDRNTKLHKDRNRLHEDSNNRVHV